MIDRRGFMRLAALLPAGLSSDGVLDSVRKIDKSAEVRDLDSNKKYIICLSNHQVTGEMAVNLADWLKTQGVKAVVLLVENPHKMIEIMEAPAGMSATKDPTSEMWKR